MKRGKKATSNPQVKTAIVIPDLQVPYHDERSLRAVEKFMAEKRWDHYINLGDFMDFDCISHHNKGKLRQIEGKRILDDYRVGNEILDRHQSIIKKKNPNAEFVLLEGNHEFRIERYLDENPQMTGIVEVENGLRLDERGFKYVRCYQKNEDYKLGKAHFHHGIYTNDHHAKKHVQRWGTNIFYGHLHDVQCFSMVTRGDNQTIVGQSLGCLCKYNQSYMKNAPSNWQQAFAVFEFYPDGFFTYHIIRIFKHRFSFDGKIYEG